jgi:hypothetical protein
VLELQDEEKRRMKQSARWIDSNDYEVPGAQHPRRLSFLKFLMRYPIFLLAFGPPIFRSHVALVGLNTSQAHFDFWNIFQVGWISLIALRAILRLTAARSILIPKQIRSILKVAFFLGLLFLASVAYSPGRIVSAEFTILYFLTLICVVEFIVDVYRDPPNWMQCLFQLRFISVLLFVVVLLTLSIEPDLVLAIIPGAGIRLLGSPVATMDVICPIISIISAYNFRHSLESRVRSTLFFLIGLTGTVITQTRGAEIALFAVLAILGIGWAKTNRRSVYIFIFGFMASILLAGVVVGTIGGERIWNTFNRGEATAGIASASGRTEIWKFAIQYCMTHPQGMGYVAGFRDAWSRHFSSDMSTDPTRIGNCHNSFIQYLADAGWLALALYLIMMAKVVALGWRFGKNRALVTSASDSVARHAIQCALLLLIFCFAQGMESSNFTIPLQGPFYYQNIIVAIILGASATLLIASRTQYTSFE